MDSAWTATASRCVCPWESVVPNSTPPFSRFKAYSVLASGAPVSSSIRAYLSSNVVAGLVAFSAAVVAVADLALRLAGRAENHVAFEGNGEAINATVAAGRNDLASSRSRCAQRDRMALHLGSLGLAAATVTAITKPIGKY